MESIEQKKTGHPDWESLYEIAASQSGYFTKAQADRAGYSGPLLAKYMQKHRVTRVGWGIYRLVHFPPMEHEDLVQLWLRFDQQAVFSHETALSLHGLSDVLPSVIHVTLPESWRKRRLTIRGNLKLHYEDLPKTVVSWVGSVKATSPARTIEDCADANLSPELVNQAIEQGLDRGLFRRHDVVKALRYVSSFGLGEKV